MAICAGSIPYMDARTQMAPSPREGATVPASAEAALCAAHQTALQFPPSAPPPHGAGLYYTVQPPKRQRGLIIAVVAAIVVAGGLIAGAILIKGGGQPAPAPVPTIASPGQPGAVTSEPGSTCAAWATAKSDLGAVTRLPAGWIYGAPGIDQTADARATQIETILTVFGGQISSTPADVAAAAHLFVEKQGAEVAKLRARENVEVADLSAIEGAEKSLNRACGG